MNWKKFWRQIHYWLSIVVAVQFLIVASTGTLLLLKKQFPWIQPASQRGETSNLTLTFDQILEIIKTAPELEINDWDDVDRLDVRPGKGIVKVRSKNHWELQIDSENGNILQTAYRRSDLIESIHDGSWFHEKAKMYVFLPTAVLLLVIWATGMYLFLLPFLAKGKKRKKLKLKQQQAAISTDDESCVT